MPTAKTATHHEFPVITIKQIGKQYNVSGLDVRQAKSKLEALGYIEPIRKGSHTYKLLKCCIPHTLAMLEEDYIEAKFTYTLPDDYPAIRSILADLIQETGQIGNRNLELYIKGKFTAACEGMKEAYDELPATLPESLRQVKFTCTPLYEDRHQPLSRQKRLENFKKLLQVIYEVLYMLDQAFINFTILQPLAEAIDILKPVSIPSTIQERNQTKCAE